jgi:polygalacturonase
LTWLVLSALLLLPATPAQTVSGSPANDPWAQVDEILKHVVPPTFPARECAITKHGAKPGQDASRAIAKAIDTCHKKGGGRVVVPAGTWDTGPIRLQSRIDLHVAKGATLRFSRDPKRYLPLVRTRWEGMDLMNYSPLVYAPDVTDVAITGEGTLDGNAGPGHWWPWKASTGPASQKPARDRLMQQVDDGVPTEQRLHGEGSYLRPTFIEPYKARNVLVEDVTIVNAPFWVIHPTFSTNVTVRRVKIISHGPNNDGVDPESSRYVLIEDSLFDTGDDCIALKSGRNGDGRREVIPVEDVVIRRNRMKAGHGGITIGSEITGGARRVFAEKNHLDSPDLERGLRIKTNLRRGGVVEGVYVRDTTIGTVQLAPIEIDLRYANETGTHVPQVRNVVVERMTSEKSDHGLFVRGVAEAPITGVMVRDSRFRGVGKGTVIEGTVDLTLSGTTIEAVPGETK